MERTLEYRKNITPERLKTVYDQLIVVYNHLVNVPKGGNKEEITKTTGLSGDYINILQEWEVIYYATLNDDFRQHSVWIGDEPTLEFAKNLILQQRYANTLLDWKRNEMLRMLNPPKEEITPKVEVGFIRIRLADGTEVDIPGTVVLDK